MEYCESSLQHLRGRMLDGALSKVRSINRFCSVDVNHCVHIGAGATAGGRSGIGEVEARPRNRGAVQSAEEG